MAAEQREDQVTRPEGRQSAPREGRSPQNGNGARAQTPEGRRLSQRISLLLSQRTGPSQVMAIMLSAALILGLAGFAFRVLWIAAVVVMALGLGFVVANGRRDRIDLVNQRQEDESDTARRGRQRRPTS